MLDVGGRDEPTPDALLESLDFISPNETELARLMNEQDPEKIGINEIRNKLLTRFPNLVVVLKLGAKGSAVVTSDLHIVAGSVTMKRKEILEEFKIVDTTGAGDCFTSAFCVKFIELLGKKDEE